MNDRQKILIADDSDINRSLLREMLGEEYAILEVANGREALQLMQEDPFIDLLLLDIVMPEMDGLQVLEAMNKNHWIEEIPVIMISAEQPSVYAGRAYDLGAVDFIQRPFDALLVRRRVVNTLMLYAKQKRLSRIISDQVYENEKNANLMVNILSHIVEFRNGESGLHVLHIQKATALLLEALLHRTEQYGLSAADISMISTASALHDIGKINIPEGILNKPGKLTAEEYDVMKQHCMIGAKILDELPRQQKDEPLLQYAYEICRWHHERFDGRGYPDGLKGDQIPISAQVVALADVYDALTSVRCYKAAYSHEDAMRMILDGECGQFNPLLLECLIDVHESLRQELQQSLPSQHYLSEVQKVSQDVIKEKYLTGQNRLQDLLHIKSEILSFMEKENEGILLEYDTQSRVLRISGKDAALLAPKNSLQMPEERSLLSLEAADQERLDSIIRETDEAHPTAELLLPLHTENGLLWHHAQLKTLWSLQDSANCIGVILHMRSVQNNMLTDPGESANISTGKGLLHVMQDLRSIFDVVRIVDVESTEILELDADGKISNTRHACYQVWSKEHRCENCISARAFMEKTQHTKLEFTADHRVFQVISKYIELEGRGVVLELVIELKDEVLMGTWSRDILYEHVSDYTRGLYRDSLTHAFNRRYLKEQLSGLRAKSGIAMMDIDNFKQLNDRLGHTAGDEALKRIADTVSTCLAKQDSLIRYGGDEFLIITGDPDPEHFRQRLERIRQEVEALSLPNGKEQDLTVSIGGIFGELTPAEAIAEADFRMYRAKSRKNAVYVENRL